MDDIDTEDTRPATCRWIGGCDVEVDDGLCPEHQAKADELRERAQQDRKIAEASALQAAAGPAPRQETTMPDAPTTPTPGRIVLYQTDGRNGLHYVLPAVVTVTRDSHPGDYPDGETNPLPVPADDLHVHLTVFTPGGFGTEVVRAGDKGNPEGDYEYVGADRIVPGSGTYVEHGVPFDPDGGPRTWRWPTRG